MAGSIPLLHDTVLENSVKNSQPRSLIYTGAVISNATIPMPAQLGPCGTSNSTSGRECGIPGKAQLVGIVDLAALPSPSASPNTSQLVISQAANKNQRSITNSTMPAPSSSDPPPSVIVRFEGDDQTSVGNQGVPPDAQIATGPNHVVEAINFELKVYNKQGTLIQTSGLAFFFNFPGGDAISDPSIMFDVLSGRWFASMFDQPGNFVKVAASDSNDPTGTWHLYQLNAACPLFNSCYPDQPKIGVSNDKLVVSANDKQTIGWQGAQYWVLNKRQMTEGAGSIDMNVFGPDSSLYSVRPAQSLGDSNDLYMVMAGCTLGCGSTTNTITEFRVTGLPPNAGVATAQFTMATVNAPPLASQPGTTTTVWSANQNDARVQTAAWFNGRLWFALNDGCTGSFTCIRLGEIYTPEPTLLESWDDTLLNQFNHVENLFYPALTIDGMGNMLLVYGYSDGDDYPSIAIAEHLITDPINTLSLPVTVVTGSTIANSGRYGDYFGAAVDPANTTNVWVAGEYMNSNAGTCGSSNCYSTYIAAASTTTFTASIDTSTLTIQRGASAVSDITLSSINAFTGQVSASPQATISITATSIDDQNARTFGLLIDQTLDQQFWVTQPSSVIGCCSNPFTYSHTFSLTPGSDFLEFGVSAWVGQWRAQVIVGGMTMATIDTDVNHHVHIIFQVGGVTWVGPQGATPPTASVAPASIVLQPNSASKGAYTISTSSSTSIAAFSVVMRAASGYQSASASRLINVIDFSVAANPSSLLLTLAGSSTTSTVTVSSLGYSGTVSLTSSVSPSSPVISLWPNSVTISNGGSSTSTLSISAGGATPGTYTGTVTGTGQSSILTAFYAPGTADTDLFYGSNSVGQGAGEVFNSTFTGSITSIAVQLKRTGGSSVISGHLRAMLYAHDGGTYGTNMIGQTPALATGDSFDITTILNDFNYYTEILTFSGTNQIMLNAGTQYVLILNLTDMSTDGNPTSGVYLGAHSDGTGYSGNAVSYNSNTNSWTSASNIDSVFQATITGVITHSTTVTIIINGDFSISASPTSLTVRVGKSGTSTLTLTSLNGFAGTVTLTNQTSISITATSTDDTFCRSFGLLFDQTLNPDFWNSQPNSVIGTGCSPFTYSHTYTLSTGTHFLEFGVSAFVGHWHAQITLNGVSVASVDTEVNHHVHVPFSNGGITISPIRSGGPTVSLSATSKTLSAGGSATVTLTVSTTRSTPTGTYSVTETATSGGLSHAVTITVTVTS